MRPPRLIRLSYFMWIALPVLMFGIYQFYGLPHTIWSYDWRPLGSNHLTDFAQRYYTRCTWIGPYGPITTYPDDGTCGLVRFFRETEVAR